MSHLFMLQSARHGATESQPYPWLESLTSLSQLPCAEGPAFVWPLNTIEPVW